MSKNMQSEVYFVGVDVGTGSVRAALVSSKGKIVKIAVHDIKTWNPKPGFYEQSSENIWNACVHCVKTVTNQIPPENVKGIGFDATCSLVAIGKNGEPISVSTTGNKEQNIILWMDHRAYEEAALINSLNHPVLRYVGGKISLEMQTPKLLWLKRNLKQQCWNECQKFFDLPDFLTWKATGSDSRSLCSVVCKWTYEFHTDGSKSWNSSYFSEIGLEDLLQDNCQKIGKTMLTPGTPVGKCISADVAKEFGVLPGTPVGTSIIDAHAGGLGLIGCSADGIPNDFQTRLALICGTSTCQMAVSSVPRFVEGVWGPYYSAMVPEMWLNEGGQSATGKLVDHIINSHPATSEIKNKIGNTHVQQYLNGILEEMAKKQNLPSVALLTNDLHVYPDFHGNRSPIADPTLKGVISGLTLSADEENLALLYLATIQALSYGTQHILETLAKYGYSFKSLLICGGLSKNPLFVQTQADAVDLPVLCPEESESVLLGAAILGACAAKYYKNVETALQSMGGTAKVVYPNKNLKKFHEKKYKVYQSMLKNQCEYRKIMNS